MKLHQYLIEFEAELAYGSTFGVTAHSEADAIDIVLGEVFHHQTIPGKYTIRQIRPFWWAKAGGDKIPRKVWKGRGIWYPEGFR